MPTREERVRLFRTLQTTYGPPIGTGRDRHTFNRGDGYVLKLGHDSCGDEANLHEAFLFAKHGYHGKIPYAKCHIEYMQGFPILIMEWVEHTDLPRKKLPRWVDSVDCQQVGYNKQGLLVAYDYAG